MEYIEAKQQVSIGLYRDNPKTLDDVVEHRIKQQMADELFATMEVDECRATTLRPIHRKEDKESFSVIFTQRVEVKDLVRCQECKHHMDMQYHYCMKWGRECPDDSEFFCAWGERADGGQDE